MQLQKAVYPIPINVNEQILLYVYLETNDAMVFLTAPTMMMKWTVVWKLYNIASNNSMLSLQNAARQDIGSALMAPAFLGGIYAMAALIVYLEKMNYIVVCMKNLTFVWYKESFHLFLSRLCLQ